MIEDLDKPGFNSRWVARYLGRALWEFEVRAVNLLCYAMRAGPYDFPHVFARAKWCSSPVNGCSFVIGRYLSTFDSDGLTRLVVGAHHLCIRVEIEGCGPNYMRIMMHKRLARTGSMHLRHPTIKAAIAALYGEKPEPELLIEP